VLALDGGSGAVAELAVEVEPALVAVAGAGFRDRLYLASGSVWRTNGEALATEKVGDLVYGPAEILRAGAALYLGSDELYRFDPETATFAPLTSGTMAGHYPLRMSALGSDLLFFTWEEATGTELWRSDGTPEGTGLVADLRPGIASSIFEPFYFPGQPELSRLVPLGPIALFAADDGVQGEELWRTDGTAAGTSMVRDIVAGAYPSSPRELTRVGDFVFFSAEAVDSGRELWISDGTSGGTRRVADLVPGVGSSVPQELAAIRDELWFSAWTPAFGREPWRARGAGNGLEVERLADIAPGPLSSSPLIFKNAGADIFTVANDNTHGFELWKLRDPDLLFADDFESSGLALWTD
jgi:ELWxxDGT repeat protein